MLRRWLSNRLPTKGSRLALLAGLLVWGTATCWAAEPERIAAQGYRLRPVEWADGQLWETRRAGSRRALGPLPPARLAELQRAVAASDLEHLPPPPATAPLPNMAKLSEPYKVVLTWPDHTAAYQFDNLDRTDPGQKREVARRLVPLMQALREAVIYLDTPPLVVKRGRFKVAEQGGRIGMAVDEWSVYRPFAPSPLVETLRPLVGKRVQLEIVSDRDQPAVFVLRRVMQRLVKPSKR